MLVAATTEMAITGYVFAYNRNQAKSDVNACGNGQVPTNIGCQNIDSQIQGDENSVALTSQQTFPAIDGRKFLHSNRWLYSLVPIQLLATNCRTIG